MGPCLNQTTVISGRWLSKLRPMFILQNFHSTHFLVSVTDGRTTNEWSLEWYCKWFLTMFSMDTLVVFWQFTLKVYEEHRLRSEELATFLLSLQSVEDISKEKKSPSREPFFKLLDWFNSLSHTKVGLEKARSGFKSLRVSSQIPWMLSTHLGEGSILATRWLHVSSISARNARCPQPPCRVCDKCCWCYRWGVFPTTHRIRFPRRDVLFLAPSLC